MRRLLVAVVGVIAATALWAVPAFAEVGHPGDPGTTTGFIEICKVAGAGITAGTPFQFSVPAASPAQATVIVRAGECSGPIAVAGTAAAGATFSTSVTETSAAFYSISNIQQTTNYNGASVSVPTTTTTFPVLAGGSVAEETRLDYTNVLVTGFVEVCKSPAANSGLTTGQFTFRIRAGMSSVITSPLFDSTVTVPLNQCSAPIAVPAGTVNVQETGGGVFVTGVTATSGGRTADIFPSLADDNSVNVTVAASATAGTETLVRFFDALSTLKICKIGLTNSLGTFTGNAAFAITGAATTSATVAAGTAAAPRCVEVGSIVPGTAITIAETAAVGAQVAAIDLNNGAAVTTSNLAAGTVTFTALNGANVVTYSDVLAPPVLVKICKAGAAAGATIPLSITGVVSTTANPSGFGAAATTSAASITIPATGGTACTDVLGPFAYGSTLSATETAPAGTTLVSATSTGNAAAATVSGSTATIPLLGTFGRGTEFIAVLTLTNGAAVAAPVTPAAPAPRAAVTGSTTTPTGTSTSSSTGAAASAAAATTPASATSLTPTPSVVSTPKSVSVPKLGASLVSARIVSVKQSGLLNRWLGMQLKGSTSTTRVKIQLVGQNGKLIGQMIRTVKTGHFVRVMKIGANVRSIRVTPLPIA